MLLVPHTVDHIAGLDRLSEPALSHSCTLARQQPQPLDAFPYLRNAQGEGGNGSCLLTGGADGSVGHRKPQHQTDLTLVRWAPQATTLKLDYEALSPKS